MTEESPLKPLSTYSESKVSAELDVLAAESRDFCPTVLRFSTAFGVSPRMRFDLLVNDFTLAAVREQKVVVYGEQFWRPFVHVRDIAASIEAVLAAALPAHLAVEIVDAVAALVHAQQVQQ